MKNGFSLCFGGIENEMVYGSVHRTIEAARKRNERESNRDAKASYTRNYDLRVCRVVDGQVKPLTESDGRDYRDVMV